MKRPLLHALYSSGHGPSTTFGAGAGGLRDLRSSPAGTEGESQLDWQPVLQYVGPAEQSSEEQRRASSLKALTIAAVPASTATSTVGAWILVRATVAVPHIR